LYYCSFVIGKFSQLSKDLETYHEESKAGNNPPAYLNLCQYYKHKEARAVVHMNELEMDHVSRPGGIVLLW
jgi:hypothetical protein